MKRINPLFGALVVLLIMFVILMKGKPSYAGEDRRYSENIKEIFDNRCVMCHGADSPEYKVFKKDKKKYKKMMKGPRMDSYTYLIYFVGWPDTGALMRRLDDGLNTKKGKPGNMYQYLGDTEEERKENLQIFKGWVGHWTLKRWSAVTKEEMDRIMIKY
jgi:hypothetical protein